MTSNFDEQTAIFCFVTGLVFLLSGVTCVSASERQGPKFHARVYMSETDALSYQKQKGDRVESGSITINDTEVTRLRKRQRVKVHTDQYKLYKIFKDGESTPYRFVIPLQQTGQHEFMDLMYGINADGSVNRIDLLVYREPHGSEVASRRFMKQFEGRSLEDSEFRLNLDVIHIAGATISARAVANGTRKVLEILRMKGLVNG